MKSRFVQIIVVILFLLLAATAGAQADPQKAVSVLTIGGEVGKPLRLSAGDLAKMPRRVLKAKDHEGKEMTFEGVELAEILKLAEVKSGEALRGKELALFLVAEASDGYRVVFALPELDRAFTDRLVIVADKRDGQPLDEKEGPLRLVVPDEKRHGRWVRQLTTLTIRRVQE